MKGFYSLIIKRSAEKEIRSLPSKTRRRVVAKIRSLAEQPRPPGYEKLAGRDAYRVRVGVYRVVYTIEDDRLIVTVVRVAHRRDVYR